MGLRERLAASATEIRARGQRLVELNVELLTAELKRKGEQYGKGVGLLVAAGVLALYFLGFALTTITVALALVLPLWLALLIVTAVLLLIVLILALVGRSTLRKAKTPAPERTIAEANTTVELLKTNLQETARVFSPRRNGGSASSPTAQPAGSESPWTPASAPGGSQARPPAAAASNPPTPPAGPSSMPPSMPPGAPTPTPQSGTAPRSDETPPTAAGPTPPPETSPETPPTTPDEEVR
jgi:uncharacterized membrane protein YqjE